MILKLVPKENKICNNPEQIILVSAIYFLKKRKKNLTNPVIKSHPNCLTDVRYHRFRVRIQTLISLIIEELICIWFATVVKLFLRCLLKFLVTFLIIFQSAKQARIKYLWRKRWDYSHSKRHGVSNYSQLSLILTKLNIDFNIVFTMSHH